MSTRPLDSAAGISPLDVCLAPAPRDQGGDGSFAQHFNTSPAPKPAEPTSPRPSAEQREPSSSRDTQQPAPTATAQASAPQEPAAETEATVSAEGQGDQHGSPTPTAVEPTEETAVAVAEEETEETETEAATTDELLLTDPVAIVPTTAPELTQPVEQATEQTESAGVAAIAEDASDSAEEAATAKSQRPTLPRPKLAQFSSSAEQAEGANEQPTDALAVETADAALAAGEAIAVAAGQVAEATASPVLADAVGAAPGEKPAKRGTKVDGRQATGEEQLVADASEETTVAGVSEVEPSVEKPRESKRDRSRGEGRNNLAEKATPAEIAAPAATSAAPPVAEAAATTLAATIAAPEVNAPLDITVPPPVASVQNPAPTAGAAPQTLQRLPQHLLTRSTTQGSAGAPPNPAEQARFVTRVAKAFQTAQARGGELQLRLSPAELGSLKLEIKLQDGVMSARVEAESAHAKNLLVDNLPVLKERLAEQGIVVEKFDVELMDRQPQGQPDTAHERQQRHTPRQSFFNKPEEATVKPTTSSDPRPLRGDGRLNVTV